MSAGRTRRHTSAPAVGAEAPEAPEAPRPGKPAVVSYQLLIEVAAPVRCRIGRLGEFVFAPGCYVYTGSARRALEARIARHLRPQKTLHWHIDYLLAAPGVSVVDVKRSARPECLLNRAARGIVVVPGFGASDCRAGCGAHLKQMITRPAGWRWGKTAARR